MLPRLLLLAFLLFAGSSSPAQYFNVESALKEKVSRSASDAERSESLGKLAEFYYVYRADRKGDSVLRKQLAIAERSFDRKLILNTFFSDALLHISSLAEVETYKNAIAFLEKALDYAKELKEPAYEGLAHIRMAAIYRKRGLYDKAFQQTSLAFSPVDRSGNDSLKTILYLELGDIFARKRDGVSAYRNYNNAFDLAYSLKNASLQAETYHHFSSLYLIFGNKEMALKTIYKCLESNTSNQYKPGMLADFIDLARLTDEPDFIFRALALADTLNIPRYSLISKQLMLAYMMVVNRNAEESLAYLEQNEELHQSIRNTGSGNYYRTLASIFRYSGQIDSARQYYLRAEDHLQHFDASVRRSFYQEMGEFFLSAGENQEAIRTFEKAFTLGEETADIISIATVGLHLSDLFAQIKNYEKAFSYSQKYLTYKDTLQRLSAQREVTLMELEREKLKYEKDLADQKKKENRIRNLQYMGISIAITLLFMLLITLGMFPISNLPIRMLGFAAFICLFEFVVLLIDNYIHHLVHGDALSIWLIKIGIIAILLPSHHFLEHTMVRFLASKKLMHLRQQLSARKYFTNKKVIFKDEPKHENASL